ncbi:YifB family Mg chelatase-like AAA ATPase [Commensalibacter oyaizuii]|uniref:YifB family Mg chelatase-like AAA ATPase n=1 Tax=Commensalibacter oyaizuii TaxID=3043873 RepID=A0ABT6PZX0_9PROT|nr:YifB family Mg chelatase-like AAA ATPase [Commensalibacter sp. TBRC 16381]MDI2090265.1 YifB family Mg chelatase-like AAA ATPase [Commensalibacter sp. TBRC 16381]
MTITRVSTFSFSGIDPVCVEVQVQITRGLPAFIMVGLADKAVTESRERVRAALISMGIAMPPKRILINLAPADIVKEGTHYDLPIALGILCAMDIIPQEELLHYAAVGELSLDGQLSPVNNVISASIGAASEDKGLICPQAQGGEALLGGDISILAPPDLLSLMQHFLGRQILSQPQFTPLPTLQSEPDLNEIKGMESAKRALEIAAAGGHSMLMIGPPGAGKSMLAARLPSLLPNLTSQQSLEVTRIYSSAGLLLNSAPVIRPPFRSPHHSASQVALTGGGAKVKPGEISLAHQGVLFLDELPEFSRHALEALRQPLETGDISIARATSHVTYPARFQFIAAMNPCRCGYMGDTERECHRVPKCKEEYTRKISGPLLDRIDLITTIEQISPKEMVSMATGESSESVAERVQLARERQLTRQNMLNNEISSHHITLSTEVADMVEKASTQLRLSARGMTRLLRVARTIADLGHKEDIDIISIAEALNFRQR